MAVINRLALLVPCHTSFGRAVVRGVLEYCRQQDEWEHHVVGHSELSVPLLDATVAAWKASAMITDFWRMEQLQAVLKYKVPTVDVCGVWNAEGIIRVQADNKLVGQFGATHLMERGLKQFAFYGVKEALHASDRRCGFMEAIKRAKYPCDCYEVEFAHRTVDHLVDERAKLALWLKQLKKPVGLMCCSDYQAREAIFACRQAGIRIPEDVAMVGVGNDSFTCEITATQISSVDIAPGRTGFVAASVVHRKLRGQKVSSQPVLIEPAGVVVRQSSDILKTENENVAAAIRFIHDHAHESIQVEDILSKIPISRRALENNFKTLLGRTPRAHIFHTHIELAKKLLLETNLSLEMVAERSGFKGTSTLSPLFLRSVGMRPGEYRKQFRYRTNLDD